MKTTLALCCALFAGCATTPPEALNQAHHSAVLIGALNDSLNEFSSQQRRLVDMTADAIARRNATVAKVMQDSLLEASTFDAAGDADYARVAERLRSVAASVAARAVDDGGAADAAKLRAALTTPEGRQAAMAQAQRAAVTMSGELEPKVRWKEQRDFMVTLRKGIKANRDRIETAQAEANKENSDTAK